MKKMFAFMLAAVVMISALSACSSSPASGDGEQSDDKVYTLNLTTHDTNTAPAAVALAEWAEQIKEASGGRLVINIHYNGTLAGMSDAVTMTSTGGVDMCWNTVSINTNFLPLSEITNYPGVPISNSLQGTVALQTIYENYDCIREEFEAMNVKILALHANAPSFLSGKKQFDTVADFKGEIIRANSTAYTILCNALEMSQMACSTGEMYENFSKNVMSSTIVDVTLVQAMHTYEVAPYIMDYNFGTPGGFVAINLDSYAKLPADLQALLDDSYHDLSFAIATNFNNAARDFLSDTEATGIVIYEPSDEVADAIASITQEQIMTEWIQAANDKGLDGETLYSEFTQIMTDAYETYGSEYDWVQ